MYNICMYSRYTVQYICINMIFHRVATSSVYAVRLHLRTHENYCHSLYGGVVGYGM